jgi:hypothetical protein
MDHGRGGEAKIQLMDIAQYFLNPNPSRSPSLLIHLCTTSNGVCSSVHTIYGPHEMPLGTCQQKATEQD